MGGSNLKNGKQTDTSQKAMPDHPQKDNGTVIAFHCIPVTVEANVQAFWSFAANELKQRGYRLLIISTAEFQNQELPVIHIPFEMTGFPGYFKVQPAYRRIDLIHIQDVAQWYQCSLNEAESGILSAETFFRDLITSTNPVAITGWQSSNPVTRMLRSIAREADIPFWSAERGWIRQTLMFDLAENNYMSEILASFALRKLQDNYTPSESTLSLIENRIRSTDDNGRYRTTSALSRQEFRSKNNIPQDATVFGIFTHGEPSINTMLNSGIRESHLISEEILNARFRSVCAELTARGYWVVVQEHPFNEQFGKSLHPFESPRVITVKGNITSAFAGADYYIFTLSTLQFEATFLEKSFGLLCKSALYNKGTPLLYTDFDSASDFIDAIQDQERWQSVKQSLRNRVSMLYDYFLLDISNERILEASRRFADHVCAYTRKIQPQMSEKFSLFVQKWLS